jgi:predicted amidohydrolase
MDLEGNYSTAERLLRSAADAECHLAVLPEFHLTSWTPKRKGFFEATAASVPYLAKYQQLARDLNMNIVPGTICEPVPPEESTYQADAEDPVEEWRNMAYFIAAGTGDICGSYQKKNLWHTERGYLASSQDDSHIAFDTPLKHADGRPVRAGMLICWDLAFPEAFRGLVLDGAELIIIPSWWYPMDPTREEGARINIDSERIFLESATTLRAFESEAAVVFCNSGGWSGVTMPVQGPLTRCGTGEAIGIAEIDLDVLRVAEEAYMIKKDLRSKDWHYGYEKKEDSSGALDFPEPKNI